MTEPAIAEGEGDGTVCSVDGAVVHVRRREARGEVPAFEYVVGTDEDAPVAVRLRQPIPGEVDLEAIGFPPACEDDWRLEDGALVCEAPVKPDEPVRTAWGVDGDGHPPIEPPSIDVVPLDPPDRSESAAAGDGAGASTEDETGAAPGDEAGAAPGDADTDPAAGGADAATDGTDAAPDDDTTDAPADVDEAVPSTFDLSDPPEGLTRPDANGGTTADAGGEATAEDPRAPEVASGPGGESGGTAVRGAGTAAADAPPADAAQARSAAEPVIARLTAELQSGDVADEHREALQDALAVRLSDSTNAFVEHLQEKLERRAERMAEEVESLEESIERVYGVKADASELDAVKRGLTDLDDRTVTQSELRDLRADHGTLVERVETTGDLLESLRTDLETLEERSAEAERVAELSETVASLREDLDALDETAATQSDLEERAEQLLATTERLDGRVDDVVADHDELAAGAATADDLESLRKSHRTKLDDAQSDLADLEETLATEYTSDAEISAEIDRRLERSLATLALFGVGATGLLSTLPLALAGSDAAAVTFAGGAASLVAWWAALGREGGFPSLPGKLPSPGDLLG